MTLGSAHGDGRLKIVGSVFMSGPQTDDYEGRGLPKAISEIFADPHVQQVAVVYSTPDRENFSIYARLTSDPNYIEPRAPERPLLPKNVVEAWFISAGFPKPARMYCLANEYDPERDDPWWLVETNLGMIKIGWRKRVINIDWSATAIRKVVTDEDVTKDETMVHAWSTLKAIEYLTVLRQI